MLLETEESNAIHIAEDIRTAVQAADIAAPLEVTVSIGICDVTQANSIDHWLSQCDRALYQAKAQGRNCVVIATPGVLG